MNNLYFENKYKSKGGCVQLKLMAEQYCTTQEIANYFGVTKERVRQWMRQYFGIKYDPRLARRIRRIKMVREMFDKMGIEETILSLGDGNSYYVQLALEEIEKEKQNTNG